MIRLRVPNCISLISNREWSLNSAVNSLVFSLRINTQQIHQRGINVETTLIVNIHQFFVDIWLKMKVEPTSIYRSCFNVGKTTLKQRLKNYVDSRSMNQCCFNVKIWLKLKVEPTYVYQRCFNVDKTMLKQHWRSYVYSMLMTQCFQRWYLVENESWINIYTLPLLWLWGNSIEKRLSMGTLICTDVH